MNTVLAKLYIGNATFNSAFPCTIMMGLSLDAVAYTEFSFGRVMGSVGLSITLMYAAAPGTRASAVRRGTVQLT